MHLPLKLAGLLPAPLHLLFNPHCSITDNLLASSVETYDIGSNQIVVGLERVTRAKNPLDGKIHDRTIDPAAYYAAMERDSTGRSLARTPGKPLYFLLDVRRYGDHIYTRAGKQGNFIGLMRDQAVWIPGKSFFDTIGDQARLGLRGGAESAMRIMDKQLAAYNAYLKNQVYRVVMRQKSVADPAWIYREIYRIDHCYGLEVATAAVEHAVCNIWTFLNN